MQLKPVIEIAHQQFGVITRTQALQLMHPWQLHQLCVSGTLIILHPATYAVAGFPNTWEQKCAAAVLSIPGAVLAGHAAARLWGFEQTNNPRIAVLVPAKRRPKGRSFTVIRTRQPFGMQEVLRGIPISSVSRALVNMAPGISANTMARRIDEARRLKLLTLEELAYCVREMTFANHRRTGSIGAYIKQNFSEDDDLDSNLERKVFGWHRSNGLLLPDRQQWHHMQGNHYRSDLSFSKWRIDIEPDGPHHQLPSIAAYDRLRDADFHAESWAVLRVPNNWTESQYLAALLPIIGSQADRLNVSPEIVNLKPK